LLRSPGEASFAFRFFLLGFFANEFLLRDLFLCDPSFSAGVGALLLIAHFPIA
jgi:hypothetical protein